VVKAVGVGRRDSQTPGEPTHLAATRDHLTTLYTVHKRSFLLAKFANCVDRIRVLGVRGRPAQVTRERSACIGSLMGRSTPPIHCPQAIISSGGSRRLCISYRGFFVCGSARPNSRASVGLTRSTDRSHFTTLYTVQKRSFILANIANCVVLIRVLGLGGVRPNSRGSGQLASGP
jgi:hypothetical protein